MELLQIGIVGIILSGLIEAIKAKFGITSLKTKALVVLMSVALGTVMYFLSGTPMLESVAGILMTATTVYAFLLK